MSDDRASRENWSKLASLVDTLLDSAPEHRAALIEELSAGDASRRLELEQLLAECAHEPDLFSRPAAERFAALFHDDAPRFPDALAEQYRVGRELGRGGMATVYLARDLKHARDVAVKVVHPAIAAALGVDRFLREIEIVAQLHHPHIVPLYDSGNADGTLYYVMPYKDEPSLRQRLDRDGPLPVADAVAVLRDVCDALAFAHARGIVHRDIKPDNVLLAGRHALITDFGVAEAMSDAGVSGMTFGTPAYMAPEQIIRATQVDHRADIYSVGVMAYELLTGKPPFDDRARENVLSAHVTTTPASLTSHRPEIPAPLMALVMKCLEKRPDDRWQSAAELVTRLELPTSRSTGRRWRTIVLATAAVVVAVGAAVWRALRPDTSWQTRWGNARIERLTDFPGSEVDAAISNDGTRVAFLADRDSVFDAFITRVGTGQFVNLTNGRLPQLYNEDVRNIGFTGDTTQLWVRVADITSPASVSTVPASGGPPTAFLSTAVMAVWSPNGAKVAYHETTPGDPIFVADRNGKNARRIFIAAPGMHSHHLSWSPDGRFLYFAHGVPPDEMDVWRIPSDSGRAERISMHNTHVAYPVLLDDRTLIYSATADDGTGPWLYMMNLGDRLARRVTTGIEHYMSVAASTGDSRRPRRLVAMVSNPSVRLWSVPISDSVAGEALVTSITLPTARSAAPRFGRDATLWYLASRAGADGLWRMRGGVASEAWKAEQGAVVGAAAPSPDGKTVCLPVRRRGRSTLYCTTSEGTGARPVAESLDVRGAASWSPDGKALAVAAKQPDGIRVYKIPLDGSAPVRLTDSASFNPVWSPNGAFIVYSGSPRARSVRLKAVTPDGKPYPVPALTVDRLGDSYRFLRGGTQLVVKLGGFRNQNFWLLDLATGRRRPLTSLRPGESLHRFDIAPDGTRIVFERVKENSDIVLIEVPR
jgi:Tol biopolymer transport system component